MPLDDVRGWMEVGELEGADTIDGVRLSWGELADFGMGFWSQETVEAAPGADLADAIPGLLGLAGLASILRVAAYLRKLESRYVKCACSDPTKQDDQCRDEAQYLPAWMRWAEYPHPDRGARDSDKPFYLCDFSFAGGDFRSQRAVFLQVKGRARWFVHV